MTTPFPFVAGQVLTAAQLNSISELPTRTLTASGAAVAADRYSRVILNGTSITYTVNSATFGVGEVVNLYNANSTVATIAAGAGGVTINGAAGLTLAQHQGAQLYAISATSFLVFLSALTPGVVQVKSTSKTDAFTMASTTFADITGLSVSITPTSTSNQILILATVNHNGLATSCAAQLRFMRDTTAIGLGDAAGNRTRVTSSMTALDGGNLNAGSMSFLDSPSSTSAITYKIQIRSDTGTTVYVNRTPDNTDSANYVRAISTISVMEVKP